VPHLECAAPSPCQSVPATVVMNLFI
jgi:hypothetical protein